MSSRDDILARVRRNQPAPAPLPAIPSFATPGGSALDRFKAGLERMGGRVVDGNGADLDALLRRLHPAARVVCSATTEVKGTRRLDRRQAPAKLEDVDVGVARAAYGVAETGSVWLTDERLGVSALGFLSQHLVVLLDPRRVLEDIHAAYRERREFDCAYGILMTGPSATADIEGVLIHGAQGVRSLTVVLRKA